MSHNSAKRPKSHPEEKLLRRLAESLHDIRLIKGAERKKHVESALFGLITSMLPTIDLETADTQILGDLLSTGHPDIIKRIQPHLQRLKLAPYQWRRILLAADPGAIEALLDDEKIDSIGAAPHVFSRVAGGDERWNFLLRGASDVDTKILAKKYRGLLANAKVLPLAAQYLRSQVARAPGAFHNEACARASQREPYIAYLLMKAGIDPDRLLRSANSWNPVLAHLVNGFKSNHRSLQLFHLASGLEQTLQNHAKVDAMLQEEILHLKA